MPDKGRRDIDRMHPRPEPHKLARIRSLAASNIEPEKAIDRRQHLQECRRVQAVPIDVVTGASVPRPGLGIRFPILCDFGSFHGGYSAAKERCLRWE
jgi:hypothetical protein